MSETPADPTAQTAGADAIPAQAPTVPPAAPTMESEAETFVLDLRAMLEAGCHFGHQTSRWDPRMRRFLFGERDGIHIIDLDQSLPRFEVALEFVQELTAAGGKVLFVSTKKQAAPIIKLEALRAGQYYVNNRWLGGMLTNWKTVKKSIERYKELIELLADEERRNELSKKELARITRQHEKYTKSLEGMKEMTRLPDALFIIDVQREGIAVSEARRLGIPIVAVVDSNCSPVGIDFVVPGNDDSIRAISLYSRAVAEACLAGDALHQERLRSQPSEEAPATRGAPTTGRRVVEIKQAPRRGRGQGGSGRAVSAGGRRRESEAPAEAASAPTTETPAPSEEGT